MAFNLEKLTIFKELSWEGQKCKRIGRNLEEFKIFKFVFVSHNKKWKRVIQSCNGVMNRQCGNAQRRSLETQSESRPIKTKRSNSATIRMCTGWSCRRWRGGNLLGEWVALSPSKEQHLLPVRRAAGTGHELTQTDQPKARNCLF